MKKRNLLFAVLAMLAISVIAVALVPPPPANQDLGFTKDSKFDQYRSSATYPNQGLCRSCHSAGVPDRHHNLVSTGKINPVTGIAYGCNNCHPVLSGPTGTYVFKERECLQCHSGLNWSRVDPTNATKASVNISRPHHINTDAAKARHCNDCHGSVIADYDDGHYVPDYNRSLVTPTTHYKIYNASSGRYWGGCYACHQPDAAAVPALFDQHDTHHTATNGQRTGALDHQGDKTLGETCNWCHTVNATGINATRPIGYPDELTFTIRGDVNGAAGTDPTNLTGCEKCHDVETIHNIQKDYLSGVAGKGHIETNWDCNGCHAFWDAGDASGFENVLVPTVYSVTSVPSKLITNVEATLTVTGTDFLSGTGTTNPIQALVEVDGVRYSGTATDTQIVVSIPGLSKGVHAAKVVKTGDWTWQEKNSGLLSLVVADPVDATSATLVKTGQGKTAIYTITITGSGFGSQPPAEFEELGAFVATTSRGKPVTYKLQVSGPGLIWSDTQIVGTVTSAASGDLVTVNILDKSDSVNIS